MVDEYKSDFVPVDSGVPQGSVLGPTLFLIYMNDLPEGIKSKVRLFADDTMCSKTISTVEDQRVLQENLDPLTIWEKRWFMSFHTQGCTALNVTRKQKKKQTSY